MVDGSPTRIAVASIGQSTYFVHDTGKTDPALRYFTVPGIPRVCGGTLPASRPPVSNLPRSLAATTLAVGDFNGDGIPDAVSITPTRAFVYLGDPSGALNAGASYTFGLFLQQVVAGDLNGDRKLDLVLADSGNSPADPGAVYILLGNGDGTFQAPRKLTVGDGPVSVAIADFDRDGRADIAVASVFSATLTVLLGQGNGTFPASTQTQVDDGPNDLLVADFNADGRPDVAVTSVLSSSVSVLLGYGDGNFQAPVSSNTGFDPGFLASADFNGDGKLDLAILFESTNTLSVMIGRGDGFFGLPTNYATGVGPLSLALADLDNDGVVDIVATDPVGHGLPVLFGGRTGAFDAPLLFAVGSAPRAVAVGDFNGDGKPDLVTANEGSRDVSVLIGGGDGTFKQLLPRVSLADLATAPRPVAVVSGDFNKDGVLDVALAQGAPGSQVTILTGKGNGTFQPPRSIATGADPAFIIAADLNGDGILDLVTANANRESAVDFGSVSILLGAGDGSFNGPANFPAGNRPVSVAAGDFNGDGKLDLAVGGSGDIKTGQPQTVAILLGRGDGTFDSGPVVTIGDTPAGSLFGSIAAGDLNGDGKLDLAFAASGGADASSIVILTGAGDGTFQTATYPSGPGARYVAIADLDGDSLLDVVVSHCCTASDVSFLRGKGDGTVQAETHYPSGASPIGLAIADFNGDGKPDVAVASYVGNGVVTVLPNRLAAPVAGTATTALDPLPAQ